MDNRNWKSGASGTPPTAPVSPSAGYPQPGDPAGPTPATKPGAFWYHKIGEELRAVQVDGGITPDDTSPLTQVRDAIRAMIAASIGSAALPGAFKNLKGDARGINNHTAVWTADKATLENAGGTGVKVSSVNVSIVSTASGANGLDTGAIAANTWYYDWIIYNPTTVTVAGLRSLSATAPAMPSGYTYKARAGAVRTDSSGTKYLLQTLQLGRKAVYVPLSGSNLTAPPQIASGSQGSITVPTWVSASVSSLVPTTATEIIASAQNQVAVGGVALLAPNNQYGAYGSTTSPPPLQAGGGNQLSVNAFGSMVLESTNVYYASNHAGGTAFCYGWVDA